MFTSLLGDLKGSFGKGFILAAWLPVSIFVGLLAAAVTPQIFRVQDVIPGLWNTANAEKAGLPTIGFFLTVTLAAFVIYQLRVAISQFFEGYWDSWPGLRNIGHWKQKRYERKLNNLNDQIRILDDQAGQPNLNAQPSERERKLLDANQLAQKRLIGFPMPGDEAHIMPTRLGNILKAAELYPYRRYGIDAIIFWPRLHGFLPAELLERLQEAKTAIDFLLLSALLSALYSFITVPYLIFRRSSWELILLSTLGWLVGWLAYQASLTPATTYGELIKVAFDLNRAAVLKPFGLELPKDIDAERKLWKDLGNFIFRNLDFSSESQHQKATKIT